MDSCTVMKFGGTSVADPAGWRRIAERAQSCDGPVLVVASAFAGISDLLERALEEAPLADGSDENQEPALEEILSRTCSFIQAAGLEEADLVAFEELVVDLRRLLLGVKCSQETPPRLRARVMSFGELACTRLGEAFLKNIGIPVRWLDSRKYLQSAGGRKTDIVSRYLEASVDWKTGVGSPEWPDRETILLTQGFLARTEDDETCLLGRGGSDTSASLFGAGLGARQVEIWTDVHGIFTADPRQVPQARLIRTLGYREAEELAAMGARVLHPRCIEPVREARLPLHIQNTAHPEGPGTEVRGTGSEEPAVIAVVCRRGATLIHLTSVDMWKTSGFLSLVFGPFEKAGISIDLLATSQASVSLTLDRIPGGVNGEPLQQALRELEQLGTVEVRLDCAVVSIVGRRIRAVLHELGSAFSVFREHPVHLMSQSAEDLNLSFVVDEHDADTLVGSLHSQLFAAARPELGPSWDQLTQHEMQPQPAASSTPWWQQHRLEIEPLLGTGPSLYLYHLETVRQRADSLVRSLPSVDRWFYAQKANDHEEILKTVVERGFGLECVSQGELERSRQLFGEKIPLLFTPNNASVETYARAFEAGAEVVVESPEALESTPELFRGREIGLRIDPGAGWGHHRKVRTAGIGSKFGLAAGDWARFESAAAKADTKVVGLHAHVGSGIFDPKAWVQTVDAMVPWIDRLPGLRWIDLGGGLGVPDRPGREPLDLVAMGNALQSCHERMPGLELRLEPGRYLVAEAGVLLVRVEQVREKGGMTYVGVSAGMNVLLRPALYGAWHGIHRLKETRDAPRSCVQVVGPICESSDVVGRDRWLPVCQAGDVLLIEQAGAYGAVMASGYNRQPLPVEKIF
jgi:diaminopimelate decarboxylase/aspartate kinase